MPEENNEHSWQPHLSLDVPLMDSDHQKMVSLLGEVYAACKRHQWDDAVKDAMFDLSLFTVQHFNREEDLMRQVDYPGLRFHEKAHQKLIKILDAISIRIAQDHAAAIDDQTLDYLFKWLIKHVKRSDHQLAKFIHAKSTDS